MSTADGLICVRVNPLTDPFPASLSFPELYDVSLFIYRGGKKEKKTLWLYRVYPAGLTARGSAPLPSPPLPSSMNDSK